MKNILIFLFIFLFNVSYSQTAWNINGNTLGSTSSIGSIDNYGVTFKTNNTLYGIINKNGNWSLGTATSYDNVSLFLNASRATGAGTKYAFYIDDNGSFSDPGLFCVKRLSEGGKIGIGVNDPQYKFHIKNITNNVLCVDVNNALDGNGKVSIGGTPETDTRLTIYGENSLTSKSGIYITNNSSQSCFLVDNAKNVGFNNVSNWDSVSRGIISIGNSSIVQPTQRSNQVDLWVADYAEGDARFYIRSESGTAIVIGKNTITGINKIGIGTSSPVASSAVDITSTTGALIIPRMTESQVNALTPSNGMIVYDTTNNKFKFYENGSWVIK